MLKSPTFLFSQSPLHISTRNLLPQIESAGGGDNRSVVNPVRNPSPAIAGLETERGIKPLWNHSEM